MEKDSRGRFVKGSIPWNKGKKCLYAIFSECIQLDFEDLIFDEDNGITLCKNCHIKEHRGGDDLLAQVK